MNLAELIRIAEREPPLPFLVIGGYAVAAHGHTRATFDIDFLASALERGRWHDRLAGAGLKLFAETSSFSQYTQPGGGDGFDLMWVDESTFARMGHLAETRNFGGCAAKVPCLDHLIALKLHALKQPSAHRVAKDADDIEVLVRRHRLDLRTPHYEELFVKYGNREIYETFLRLLRKS
jgi:hypothetical protein